MNKEYPVSEEIKELFIEEKALADCRDAAIKNVFGYRRSIKYAKEKARVHFKVWNLIYELYPELKRKNLSYDHQTGVVTIKDE